ncbi:MAG: shikimate kinase [Bdellovibrionia bacterium]
METQAPQLSGPSFRLFFTGFMGAGKSTVAQLLSTHFQLPWLDTDRRIEQIMGIPVAQVFERFGEEVFRQSESQVLRDLDQQSAVFIALGGGSLVRPGNLARIQSLGRLVYLKAQPGVLWERIQAQPQAPIRPWAQNGFEAFKQLLEQRELTYGAADWILPTDGKTPKQVVEWIAQEVLRKEMKVL